MEAPFIRQQIEAKLTELSLFLKLYIESCEKEKKTMQPFLSPEDVATFQEVLADLNEMQEATSEMALEVDLAAHRLKALFEVYHVASREKAKALLAQRSSTHEGITILRTPLKWSTYGQSVGYDEDHALLDIEYQGGKVYRYQNVPKALFDKIMTLSSLRDLKKTIDGLEFVKL